MEKENFIKIKPKSAFTKKTINKKQVEKIEKEREQLNKLKKEEKILIGKIEIKSNLKINTNIKTNTINNILHSENENNDKVNLGFRLNSSKIPNSIKIKNTNKIANAKEISCLHTDVKNVSSINEKIVKKKLKEDDLSKVLKPLTFKLNKTHLDRIKYFDSEMTLVVESIAENKLNSFKILSMVCKFNNTNVKNIVIEISKAMKAYYHRSSNIIIGTNFLDERKDYLFQYLYESLMLKKYCVILHQLFVFYSNSNKKDKEKDKEKVRKINTRFNCIIGTVIFATLEDSIKAYENEYNNILEINNQKVKLKNLNDEETSFKNDIEEYSIKNNVMTINFRPNEVSCDIERESYLKYFINDDNNLSFFYLDTNNNLLDRNNQFLVTRNMGSLLFNSTNQNNDKIYPKIRPDYIKIINPLLASKITNISKTSIIELNTIEVFNYFKDFSPNFNNLKYLESLTDWIDTEYNLIHTFFHNTNIFIVNISFIIQDKIEQNFCKKPRQEIYFESSYKNLDSKLILFLNDFYSILYKKIRKSKQNLLKVENHMSLLKTFMIKTNFYNRYNNGNSTIQLRVNDSNTFDLMPKLNNNLLFSSSLSLESINKRQSLCYLLFFVKKKNSKFRKFSSYIIKKISTFQDYVSLKKKKANVEKEKLFL